MSICLFSRHIRYISVILWTNFDSWPQKFGLLESLWRSSQEIWESNRPPLYLCQLSRLDGCLRQRKHHSVPYPENLPTWEIPERFRWNDEHWGCPCCISIVSYTGSLLFHERFTIYMENITCVLFFCHCVFLLSSICGQIEKWVNLKWRVHIIVLNHCKVNTFWCI